MAVPFPISLRSMTVPFPISLRSMTVPFPISLRSMTVPFPISLRSMTVPFPKPIARTAFYCFMNSFLRKSESSTDQMILQYSRYDCINV